MCFIDFYISMTNLTTTAKLIDKFRNTVSFSDLSAVALSNQYSDLYWLPNIPVVNNSIIKFQKNWFDVEQIMLNQPTGSTVNFQLSKTDVWLWNVDNTSDMEKPISNAVSNALSLKVDINSVYTKAEVDAAISSAMSTTFSYKWTVENYSDLPNNANIWDVYNVENSYWDYPAWTNFAWNWSDWDSLWWVIDMSLYLTKTEAANTYLSIVDAANTYATKTELSDATANISWVTTTQPWTPKIWSVYFDTTRNKFMIYNWTSWVVAWIDYTNWYWLELSYNNEFSVDTNLIATVDALNYAIQHIKWISITEPQNPNTWDIWFDASTQTIKLYNWLTRLSFKVYSEMSSQDISSWSSNEAMVISPSVINNYVSTQTSSMVSNESYSNSWDNDTTHAPSKNAMYSVLWDIITLLDNI